MAASQPKENNHGKGTATQQQGEEETEAAQETGYAHNAGTTPHEVIVAEAQRAGTLLRGGRVQREAAVFLDFVSDWPVLDPSGSSV